MSSGKVLIVPYIAVLQSGAEYLNESFDISEFPYIEISEFRYIEISEFPYVSDVFCPASPGTPVFCMQILNESFNLSNIEIASITR